MRCMAVLHHAHVGRSVETFGAPNSMRKQKQPGNLSGRAGEESTAFIQILEGAVMLQHQCGK